MDFGHSAPPPQPQSQPAYSTPSSNRGNRRGGSGNSSRGAPQQQQQQYSNAGTPSSYRGQNPRGGRGRGSHHLAPPHQQAFSSSHRGGGQGSYHSQNDFGHGSGYSNQRRPSQQQDTGVVTLEITGHRPEVSFIQMRDFLNTNAQHGFRYQRMTHTFPTTLLYVQERDAQMILNLSGKEIVPGQGRLTITTQQGSGSGRGGTSAQLTNKPLTPTEQQQLQQFVQTKYNASARALDLSRMRQSLSFAEFNNTALCADLCTCIHVCCPEVRTVDLSHNAIVSMTAFEKLHAAAPTIVALSLSDNQLSSLEELQSLADSGFNDTLIEFMLQNNPVLQQQFESPLLYHDALSQLFPRLKALDAQPLQPLIAFDLPSSVNNALPPMSGSFFDHEQNKQLCVQFVNTYFESFDCLKSGNSVADRQQLLSAYDAQRSQFSLHCATRDSNIPLPAAYTAQSRSIEVQTQSHSHSRHSHSRGHSRHSSSGSASLPLVGSLNIVYALSALPMTQHDTSNFVADVFVLPLTGDSMVQTCIRGTFKEIDTQCIRSFHRVFLLTKATPDAQSKGFPFTILNDQLTIGASKMLQPEPSVAAAPPAQQQPQPSSQQGLPPMSLQEQEAVQRLCAMSGAPPLLALQSLQASAGNAQEALVKLQQYLQSQQRR